MFLNLYCLLFFLFPSLFVLNTELVICLLLMSEKDHLFEIENTYVPIHQFIVFCSLRIAYSFMIKGIHIIENIKIIFFRECIFYSNS